MVPNFVQIDVLDIKENLMKIEKAGVSFPMSKLTLLRCCKLLFSFRVGQGFWVYGIQGLFKSGIRYIAA